MGFFPYHGKVNARNVHFIPVREIRFSIYCQLTTREKQEIITRIKFCKICHTNTSKISDSLHGDIFDQRARSLHSVISCTEYSKAEKVHLHHYT